MKLHLVLLPALGLATGMALAPALAEPGVARTLDPLRYNPQLSLAPLVELQGPAVVNIDVTTHQGHDRTQRGQGSGFLISSDGYILTNNHVVAHADEVTIRLADEREYMATVVGTDPNTDVALVKIDTPEGLPFLPLGSSEALAVGDWVVAIGNPFGLSHTVTAGIVSAKGRVIGAGPYDDFIQTDASINPGSSGGPLFNLSGEVVGINTAINPHGQGIAYSVPIDMVTPIIDALKENGKVSRGWIGISLQELDADLAQRLKVDVEGGALVAQVYPGTPAHQAGLEAGDIITNVAGEEVGSSEALVRSIGLRKPGETVKITIIRKGQAQRLSVVLGERPSRSALRAEGGRGR